MTTAKKETEKKPRTEVIVTIGDKDYTLRMTRAAVRYGEEIGLDLAKIEQQPITQLTHMVRCALYGGGVRLSSDKMLDLADEYLDNVEDTGEVIEMLAQMYTEVFPTRD